MFIIEVERQPRKLVCVWRGGDTHFLFSGSIGFQDQSYSRLQVYFPRFPSGLIGNQHQRNSIVIDVLTPQFRTSETCPGTKVSGLHEAVGVHFFILKSVTSLL